MTVRPMRPLAATLVAWIILGGLAGCGGSAENAGATAAEAQGADLKQVERVRKSSDTTAPTISVSSVGALDANGGVQITGVAGDNVRVSAVTWSNDLGGSGSATTSGSGTSITWTVATGALQFGTNTITIRVADGAGNAATATRTVTRATTTTSSGSSSSSSSSTSTTSSGWVKVADEGQSFTLSSAQTVRYGADTSWVTKTISGTAPCTNAYFGSDPAYMVVKSCQVPDTSTSASSTPPPATAVAAVPTVQLSAAATSVNSGSGTTLTWSSTDASSCSASGAWSGTLGTSGSASTGALLATSTFTLTCSGSGGSASQSVSIGVVANSGPITALDFPSNGTTSADIRFRFTGSSLLPMYPATYIWRVKLRQQPGYYTTFFWGPDGAFTGKDYYGAHPYPDGGGSSTPTHKWELSIWGSDYVNDANGNSTQLGYDVWRTQALRVWDNGSAKMHEFYWDLPDTTKVIRIPVDRSYGSQPPSNAALTFGDAPWNLGGERLSGLLRGLQLYSSVLSVNDILAEVNAPLGSTAGASSIWYLNLNPTPSDISDKSGKGHHPAWVSSARAGAWTGQ